MLVLGRFPGQSVMIGDHIEVRVLEVADGGKVKLGFIGAKEPHVAIWRKEVWREKRNAGAA